MSINYSFFDNQTIGVDDLNKITSRFVTSGVARRPSSVSDLNTFVTDVATAGIIPESDTSLKVTVSNGVLTVNKGIAIFQNGTVIELTDSESMSYSSSQKQYVYLISDMASNRAYLDVLDQEATFENKILLAEIENNTVVDKRQYSKGKLAYYASADVNKNVSFQQDNIEKLSAPDADGYYTYKININPNMYKCVQIFDANSFNFTRYNFSDKSFLSFGYGNASVYALNDRYMVVAGARKQRWQCDIYTEDNCVTFKFKKDFDLYHNYPLSLKFEFIA